GQRRTRKATKSGPVSTRFSTKTDAPRPEVVFGTPDFELPLDAPLLRGAPTDWTLRRVYRAVAPILASEDALHDMASFLVDVMREHSEDEHLPPEGLDRLVAFAYLFMLDRINAKRVGLSKRRGDALSLDPTFRRAVDAIRAAADFTKRGEVSRAARDL